MAFNQFPLVKHLIPFYTLTAQNKKGPAFSVSAYEQRVSWKLGFFFVAVLFAL